MLSRSQRVEGRPLEQCRATGLIAGDGPGAALGSSVMTEDQIALKELVDEATLGGGNRTKDGPVGGSKAY
jgi:hypothetical protein